MNKPLNLAEIISNFQISVDPDEVKVFGNGHINDTYLLKATDPDNPGYLLQKINHHIFKDVVGLTRNIWLVTNHLRDKIKESHDIDAEKKVLRLIPAKDGSFYYKDNQGQYWRVYDYLAGTNSYDIVSTEKQAYEGGKAFGRFQSMLSDLDAGLLIATIPDFLNMTKRMEAFDRALSADAAGRVAEVQEQIQFVRQRAAEMCYFQSLAAVSTLPLRVTHNDTKFNNVLLDQNDEAQCVIDLDTVMPGYVAYDFGDAIRSIINTAAEDEADLAQIKLNIPLFKAYTEGYFKEASQFLLPLEIASLMKGVLLLPFMQSVRFLTDYLEGDQYYKIHFEGHNLQRTNAQIQLLRQLEQHQTELSAIIEKAGQQMTGKTITN
jgi:aminoglycoside phosphotransferase (APT) family kinase protein